MSTTTVAELKAVLGVGTLYDSSQPLMLQEVCDAADNALLPFLWMNENYKVIVCNRISTIDDRYNVIYGRGRL